VYQQCIIIGNLGRDPEMRYTPDGTPVTDFSVAVGRSWTGRDGQKHDDTVWFKVTCWNKLAETTNQYLKKGRQVMVMGEVKASAFMGQDGQPRASLDLRARDVRFIGTREGGEGASGGFGGSSSYPAQEEEDIPF
jgi:single-strand DNA-binding protein